MSVAVIIPVFGDPAYWTPLADRAAASAENQTVKPEVVMISRAHDLKTARNSAAEVCDSEWLVFLDADDELDPNYLEAMLNASGDIRQPATLGVVDGKEDPFPVVLPAKPLIEGNYIVIGAMVRREEFILAGGFRDYPIYEDWDLWIRLVLRGASVQSVPAAIYRVHVREDSRNNQDRQIQLQYYQTIRDSHAEKWKMKFG